LLNWRACLRPVTLEEMEQAGGVVGKAEGERVLRWFGEPDRIGCARDRLFESAELGEAQDEVEAIEDRCRRDVSEPLVDESGGKAARLPVASSTTCSYSPRW